MTNCLKKSTGMETLCGAILAAAMAASGAEWISVPGAPVYRGPVDNGSRAADGTSWFARPFTNALEVASAKWTVSGLGVFEVFVNGERVGDDFLKPGFTHWQKTKYSFTYDVTKMLKRGIGERNVLAAEVSSGWWRDKIVTPAHGDASRGFAGDRSAFLGDLEVTYTDGSVAHVATDAENWMCGIAGSVTHAAIFDGEEFDARIKNPVLGEGLTQKPEVNTEFKGEVLPTRGAEVTLRRDLAITRGPYSLKKDETILVDFGQNAAFVPEFAFCAKRGTVLTALCGEMLNDADAGERGCDGPKGTLYRANLRVPDAGMRLVYTFAGGGAERYMPRFTFFGYRYLSLTATDDVEIESVMSIPVTSIRRDMEIGHIETGVREVNQLISNIYWGQLSNYLSVPTDCPQRNERLGWTGDTQVFAEAGAFNADTSMFLGKWMRDMRDSQHADGSFPGVAPTAQYGDSGHRLGWADAGVIVPWTVWRMFGDAAIVNDNWAAMTKYMSLLDRDRYESQESMKRQWADWLSFEKLETWSGAAYETGPDGNRRVRKDALEYWQFLGLCYWLMDARMMAEMAVTTGRGAEAEEYAETAERARGILREKFVSKEDGMLIPLFRDMQTPSLFALKSGLLEGDAKERTVVALRKNIADRGDCLQTGFLGTSIIMDTLTECGAADVAYTLLLQHKNPSWLYSVDQGATTVWERWNSYSKAEGFGPVAMNSFNHYAYGAVLAWMYKTAAGIAPDSSAPGFRRIIMAPKPDRRLGFVKAEYKSAAGLIKSAWRYEGGSWVWKFTIPANTTALVTVPGGEPKVYSEGTHEVSVIENRGDPGAGARFPLR